MAIQFSWFVLELMEKNDRRPRGRSERQAQKPEMKLPKLKRPSKRAGSEPAKKCFWVSLDIWSIGFFKVHAFFQSGCERWLFRLLQFFSLSLCEGKGVGAHICSINNRIIIFVISNRRQGQWFRLQIRSAHGFIQFDDDDELSCSAATQRETNKQHAVRSGELRGFDETLTDPNL